MRIRAMIVCLVYVLFSFVLVSAQDLPSPTPARAWERLKAGNQRFATDKMQMPDLGAVKRQALAKGQKPFAVVLSCADSRVAPELLFNQGLGDLFVLRVVGNISDPFVMGSIDYAIEHLHAPLIVVLGHEDCGAVKAALGKDKPGGNLGRLIAEVHTGRDLPPDKNTAMATAVRNNACFHAEQILLKSEIVKEHVEKKKLRIVSGCYSLSSGKVEWLTPK